MLKQYKNSEKIWYNGGFIRDIFSRDASKKYMPQYTCPEAQKALKEGIACLKPKGLSGALSYDPKKEQFYLWWRKVIPYRQGHSTIHRIPEYKGGNESIFHANNQTWRVTYQLIDPRAAPRQYSDLYKKMYQMIDYHQKELLRELEEHDFFITLEWLHLTFPFAENEPLQFCLHHEQMASLIMTPECFDEFESYFLSSMKVNGIVFKYGRTLFKVEANGFVDVPENDVKTVIPYFGKPMSDHMHIMLQKKMKKHKEFGY